MLLLEAANLKKYYSDRLIVSVDDLKIYTGDRIGVIGQNGSGKTTLLDMLSGSIEPDEGYVKRYCEIGYIRQFDGENEFLAGKGPKLSCDKVGDDAPGLKLLREFELNHKLQRDVLSGGEFTRMKIAGVFSRDNILVFADEPTANLDYKGIDIFKRKLTEIDSFMLISHDRDLLDTLCNKILEVKDGKIRIFGGNYTFYRQQCDMERKRAFLEYEKYIREKTALEEAISNRKQRAKKMRKAPSRMGNSEARLHTRAANEKQEKLHNSVNSLITRLEKLEPKEKPREQPTIKLDFSLTNPPENKVVISTANLSFSYGSLQIFSDARFNVYNGKKTALWGENGTGKTTLLNLIYKEYRAKFQAPGENRLPGPSSLRREPSGISGDYKADFNIVPKARLGYFHQGFENLVPGESVLWNVMRDSVQNETVARTILARLLIRGDDVYKRVEVLSGGEKIKAAFAKLFVSNANVLLLDEPTNYLDMASIEALESVLKEYEGTVLFASHDRAFVNEVADRLLVLKGHEIYDYDMKLAEFEKHDARRNPANNTARKNAPASGGVLNSVPDDIERTMLQMRLTEIIAKISSGSGDKEALEEEYRRVMEKLT
ncbi:MAG: ABC-F family ATP-binding cassette domain-containing protein [Bacillota bacterium]